MPGSRRITEIIAGVFVLASVALLLLIVVLVGKQENVFRAHYQIIGLFKSASGLQPGAQVQLAGINVGYVSNVVFGPQKRVEVKISIDQRDQKRIRADSVATIRTMGLMGNRYIEITLGSPNEPVIPNGGIIKTSPPFELSDLAEAAEPVLKGLGKVINNLLVLTHSLVERSNELDTFLNNITNISDQLEQGKGTIGALLKSDALYRKLDEILDTTGITIKNIEAASGNAAKASVYLPALLNEARSSASHFDEFSVKADAAASDALKFIQAGQMVMQRIKIITSNLEQVSKDMKEASPRLDPLLKSAQAAIDEARELFRTAEHSWLLGGPPEREHKVPPIAVEGRDIIEPRENK